MFLSWRWFLSPLLCCMQSGLASIFYFPWRVKRVWSKQRATTGDLNTSNRCCSSTLSAFSSYPLSLSASTQELSPTQISVARQLRNIAALTNKWKQWEMGELLGLLHHIYTPCHSYNSLSTAASNHWFYSESAGDKFWVVWSPAPWCPLSSFLSPRLRRPHFPCFYLSSSFSYPWWKYTTLITTIECQGFSKNGLNPAPAWTTMITSYNCEVKTVTVR